MTQGSHDFVIGDGGIYKRLLHRIALYHVEERRIQLLGGIAPAIPPNSIRL
jgi:hypothetical protein